MPATLNDTVRLIDVCPLASHPQVPEALRDLPSAAEYLAGLPPY